MTKKFAKCSKDCRYCKGCGEILIPEITNLYPLHTEFHIELCEQGTWVEEKFNNQPTIQYRKYKNKNNKLESPDDKTPAVERFRHDGSCYAREFRRNGRLHSPNATTPSREQMDFDGRVIKREFHRYGKRHSPNDKTPAYETFYNKSSRKEYKIFFKNGVRTSTEIRYDDCK